MHESLNASLYDYPKSVKMDSDIQIFVEWIIDHISLNYSVKSNKKQCFAYTLVNRPLIKIVVSNDNDQQFGLGWISGAEIKLHETE